MAKDKHKKNQPQRHDPLHVQLNEENDFTHAPIRKQPRQKFIDRSKRGDEEEGDGYLDAKMSKKILKIAKEQQADFEDSMDASEQQPSAVSQFAKSVMEASDEEFENYSDNELEYEEVEVDEADAEIMSKFMPSAPRAQKTLADLIMQKIEAKNAADSGNLEMQAEENVDISPLGLDPKVVEAYTKVGTLLSRYKSGKLPKAFKIIPSLGNWEEILYLTRPEDWTPHATYQATRIFVSNLKAKQVHRFFSLVLLDRVRDDIAENKKLNYQLYMALKKGTYKPSAFFKGILFPLCESGTCTLKEAAIVGSVISKVSIPVLHSSAALLRLADMEYTGPNSLFIRILLDKKYALPYKVIIALVEHFCRFKNDSREMPVLWHQSLLVFVQRYRQDLVSAQRQDLLELVKTKFHHGITPEIRRELNSALARNDRDEDEDMMLD
ncbi:Bystin-domain-containing protein [Umbelopsis sp. PMI_123]|nr:Bystin-domain-containing protein [Umbelopsis sp. PMI_123]